MALKFQDYYDVLEVDRTASAEDIKLAFRKLARVHHPDVAKNKVTGEAKFKEINEAYEVLGDPEKRKKYDELGANWQGTGNEGFAEDARGRGAPHGGSGVEFDGTGFSDFFESFFAGGQEGRRPASSGRAGRREPDFPHPGHDVEADLLVTLEEVLRGSSRKVTLKRPAAGDEAARSNTYQVRIPAGVHEGQRIRLAGQGGRGAEGGTAGDLYLRVRLARHPDFSLQGNDLYYDLDVTPWEAVLGMQAKIPALDGATSLRVPPGTAAGSHLRLRGLGLPKGDASRGDLYAIVKIQLPVTVSPEERTHWEKLAELAALKSKTAS